MTSYRCGKCGKISTYRKLKDFVSRQRFVRASWGAGKRENAENTDRGGWRCPTAWDDIYSKPDPRLSAGCERYEKPFKPEFQVISPRKGKTVGGLGIYG